MKTLLLFLFISLGVQAQPEGMVLIEGYSDYKAELRHGDIPVPDSLTKAVMERWEFDMEHAEDIDYEDAFEKIQGVYLVKEHREFLYDIKEGIIYLNDRLNKFPYTKIATIRQALFENNGGKVCRCFGTRVTARFDINERSEKMFQRQVKNNYMMSYIITALK